MRTRRVVYTAKSLLDLISCMRQRPLLDGCQRFVRAGTQSAMVGFEEKNTLCLFFDSLFAAFPQPKSSSVRARTCAEKIREAERAKSRVEKRERERVRECVSDVDLPPSPPLLRPRKSKAVRNNDSIQLLGFKVEAKPQKYLSVGVGAGRWGAVTRQRWAFTAACPQIR